MGAPSTSDRSTPPSTSLPHPPTALTIGTFDGVHLGHRELLRACREFVDQHADSPGGRVVALAFDPHPLTTLRPASAPPRLTSFARKRELLLAQGADEVVRLEPSPAMLSQSAEQFAEWLLDQFRPALIVEGGDFHFGKDRMGSVRTLRAIAEGRGGSVREVAAVEVVLTDHAVVRASSTLARVLVGHGRVLDAQRVLGRRYELSGVVVQGDRLGRTIGLPTCNLLVDGFGTPDCCLLPANGVYAGVARLPGGERVAAAINVGERPTVRGVSLRVEAVLLDAQGGLASLPRDLPEYGWRLTLEFDRFLRDQVRFANLQALREQIVRDCARAASAVRSPHAAPEPDAPRHHPYHVQTPLA